MLTSVLVTSLGLFLISFLAGEDIYHSCLTDKYQSASYLLFVKQIMNLKMIY